MPDKQFLLGVGCQKGGTTWLHQYLESHPQCNLGFQKEYHIFDAHFLPESCKIHQNRQASLDAFLQRKVENEGEADAKLEKKIWHRSRLLSFHKDPGNYADYFATLYDEDDETRLVGDITPAYSGLSSTHFAEIRSLLESRGFNVKVIFLMRDPIERIYSAIYMEIARKKRRKIAQVQDPETLFLSKYHHPKSEMKTRYENTIRGLDESFDKGNVYLGFYETLFNDAGVRDITDFLAIDFVEPNTGKKVHAAKEKQRLSFESILRVREYYDGTYRFCYDRFGREFITSIWKNAEPRPPAVGIFDRLRNLVSR